MREFGKVHPPRGAPRAPRGRDAGGAPAEKTEPEQWCAFRGSRTSNPRGIAEVATGLGLNR